MVSNVFIFFANATRDLRLQVSDFYSNKKIPGRHCYEMLKKCYSGEIAVNVHFTLLIYGY